MQIYLLLTDLENKVFTRKDEALKYFEDSKKETLRRRRQKYWHKGWQILYKVKYSSSIDLIKLLLESPKYWVYDNKYIRRELIIDFPFDSGRFHDLTYKESKK